MQLNRHWHTKLYFNQTMVYSPPQKPSVKKTKTKDKIAGDVTLVFYELDITVL